VKRTDLIGLSLVALFLCSTAVFALQPQPEAKSLDQMRQQIFSQASDSPQTVEPTPITGIPQPQFMFPCQQFLGCAFLNCWCSTVNCAACGVESFGCTPPADPTCVCNPPC
jgi:hypothetical protein